MAHDSNQQSNPIDKKAVVSFQSSFWLVIILVFLFIGALNFMQAESSPKEEGKANTEMKAAENTGNKEEAKKPEAAAPAENAPKEEGTKK